MPHDATSPSSRIASTTTQRCYIIAEVGQNHQGEFTIAKDLLRTAALCGVDAVKLQKRCVRELLSDEEYRRPYDTPHSFGKTYGEHREALELHVDAWVELMAYAREIGVELFGSAWDLTSAAVLQRLGCAQFKVPSAALTNLPLLERLGSFGKPIIVSTGMSTIEEIDRAVEVLRGSELYLLQCTSAYPAPFDQVHLRAMETLAQRYGCPVGLSGHHRGIAVDAAAVALGARLLERHFTLDRTWRGTDHAASLEPPGLSRLVRDVRAVEAALGSPEKVVLGCEQAARAKLRGVRQVTPRGAVVEVAA